MKIYNYLKIVKKARAFLTIYTTIKARRKRKRKIIKGNYRQLERRNNHKRKK
jgi:hypothetical protein